MILMSLRFRICHLELTRLMIKEGVPPPPGWRPQTSTSQHSRVLCVGHRVLHFLTVLPQMCGCLLCLYLGDSYSYFSREPEGNGAGNCGLAQLFWSLYKLRFSFRILGLVPGIPYFFRLQGDDNALTQSVVRVTEFYTSGNTS